MPQDRERQTVRALRNTLRDLPGDALIVISSDAEGNAFRLLDGVDPEASWDEKANDLSLHEGGSGATPAVVLFPEH